MEEQNNTKVSIWRRDLNLAFVYIVIFLAGIIIIYAMTTVLNNKVNELNEGLYTPQVQNNNI